MTVLCPGPSLTRFSGGASPVIGVNRAVLHSRCDWWAASDYPLIKRIDPGYPCKLFTNADTKVLRPERFIEIRRKEELFEKYPPKQSCWTLFTAPSALVLAASLGATEIDVWGCDFSGVSDWDGHQYEWKVGEEAWRTRGGEKWKPQIETWNSTVAMLANIGVKVVRNGIA